MDRSSKGNHHSGGYVALKSERKGALVEKKGKWWRIIGPNGSFVDAPDRQLYPSEYIRVKALIKKLLGIVIALIAAITYYNF